MAAEVVLRCLRVELVKHEIGFARNNAELRIRHTVPERASATAQRTVAVDDVVELGLDLECDSTTVAGTLIGVAHVPRAFHATERDVLEPRASFHASASERWFGLCQPVIFCMGTDPDPQHAACDFDRQRPMVHADPRRPKLAELLEVQ